MATLISNYLTAGFDHKARKAIIKRAVNCLKIAKKKYKFKTIVFTGVSGALFATTLADKLGVGLTVIRKPDDDTHSTYEIEGLVGVPYIIVDDFVYTGDTVKKIISDMAPDVCVGLYLWNPNADVEKPVIKQELGLDCLNLLEQTAGGQP